MATHEIIEKEVVLVVEDDKGRIREVDIIEEVISVENHDHHHDELHIFVNRIKKTKHDGVKHEMTGCEIAALVPVSCDVAVVKRGHGADAPQISLTEPITVCNGEHFLVTRDKVNGGHE